MKILMFVLLALLGGLAAGQQCYGVPGVFDFYVLRQTWPATFCADTNTPNGTNKPLCANPTDFMQSNLVLHGLWPSYDQSHDGHMWPQCCPNPWGPDLNQSVVDQWLPELLQLWPDANTPIVPYNSSIFWSHEWRWHGVCSGLDQSDYLGLALNRMQLFATPTYFDQIIGAPDIPLDDIYSLAYNATPCKSGNGFGNGWGNAEGCWVGVGCDGQGRVATVSSCWDRRTLAQIQCPNSAFELAQLCDAFNVTLPSFPQNP